MSIPFSTNIAAIDASTADKTSEWIDVSKRQQICVQFVASAITSGNGVFTIDGTNDETRTAIVTGLAFQDAQATASATWITSKTLSSNTSAAGYLPGGFRYIRVKVDMTTDGTYSAIVQNGG